MKKNLNIRHILSATLACLAMSLSTTLPSCDKASTIGTDLVSEEITLTVDSTFTVSGHSVVNNAVLSRTVVQLMGIIDTEDFGYFKSDVVTQFMPTNNMDTVGVTVEDIDSLRLVMLVNADGFVGDSLAIMGLDVYPLTRQLQIPMYSNFDPEGYYDPSQKLGSTVYNLTKGMEPDSLQKNAYVTISAKLPRELGQKFFAEYRNNPATYNNPSAFAKFFPGLYLKNSYGSGRVTRIANTTMRLYYHRSYVNDNGNDTTIYRVGSYFAVTPEIITNNDITFDISSVIKKRVEEGQAIIIAPAGMDVEIKFPAREIIAAYKTGTADGIGVVNKLSFQLPVEAIDNKYNITSPTDVLLVLKKDCDEFFLQNKLPDDVTSFRATLSALEDGSIGYSFPEMRQYILDLMAKDTVEDDDITFRLVPVLATTETNNNSYYGSSTTTLTAITPYVFEPRMTQVLIDKAKIYFIYSRQTTNF
ncbi:MAG: DUF4270 family protein [Muribaculaceae bacterium]|nr:DUF4270 family protein [Muribaculaceae bacterium]